jgi:hypothetical protein
MSKNKQPQPQTYTVPNYTQNQQPQPQFLQQTHPQQQQITDDFVVIKNGSTATPQGGVSLTYTTLSGSNTSSSQQAIHIAATKSDSVLVHTKMTDNNGQVVGYQIIEYSPEQFKIACEERLGKTKSAEVLEHLHQQILEAVNNTPAMGKKDKEALTKLANKVLVKKGEAIAADKSFKVQGQDSLSKAQNNSLETLNAQQELLDKAAVERKLLEKPGFVDHLNQYRYEKERGSDSRRDTFSPKQLNPLRLLGNLLNATCNFVGAAIRWVTDKVADGLRAISDKIDEKLSAARTSEPPSVLGTIGWGLAKLFVGAPAKVAAHGIEGAGKLAQGACAMAGAACRVIPGCDLSAFRTMGKIGSRMVIDALSTGIEMTKEMGHQVGDLGKRIDVPVLSPALEMLGSVPKGVGQVADVMLQGSRAVANGQGKEFASAVGDAIKNEFSMGIEATGHLCKAAWVAVITNDDLKKEKMQEFRQALDDKKPNTELDAQMKLQKEQDAFKTDAKESSYKITHQARLDDKAQKLSPEQRNQNDKQAEGIGKGLEKRYQQEAVKAAKNMQNSSENGKENTQKQESQQHNIKRGEGRLPSR